MRWRQCVDNNAYTAANGHRYRWILPTAAYRRQLAPPPAGAAKIESCDQTSVRCRRRWLLSTAWDTLDVSGMQTVGEQRLVAARDAQVATAEQMAIGCLANGLSIADVVAVGDGLHRYNPRLRKIFLKHYLHIIDCSELMVLELLRKISDSELPRGRFLKLFMCISGMHGYIGVAREIVLLYGVEATEAGGTLCLIFAVENDRIQLANWLSTIYNFDGYRRLIAGAIDTYSVRMELWLKLNGFHRSSAIGYCE
jgi:hypothetical protein